MACRPDPACCLSVHGGVVVVVVVPALDPVDHVGGVLHVPISVHRQLTDNAQGDE